VVIPNGIRWSDYQNLPASDQFRRRYLSGDDGPIVMNLGRLSHKKGLDILVRAFSLVVKEIAQCRLVVVGPDDEGLTPRLQALAEREGVLSRVVFTGMLRGGDKLAALAAADVWALPSHTENFGIAVVEALAAGLPTVISPGVNIAPTIAAADAGVVCELTPEAFASEIVGLLRDDGRRAGLGSRAREFAKRYDWAAIGPKLAEMYAEAAGRRAQANT
jgi:glycosyltransferase involved in cell wall biosynthesis